MDIPERAAATSSRVIGAMGLGSRGGGVVREDFWDIRGPVVEVAGSEGLRFSRLVGRESLVSEDRGDEGDSPSMAPLGDAPEILVCCVGHDVVCPFTFGVDGGLLEGASYGLEVFISGCFRVGCESAAFDIPPGNSTRGEGFPFIAGRLCGRVKVCVEGRSLFFQCLRGKGGGEGAGGEMALPNCFVVWGDGVTCEGGRASRIEVVRGDVCYQKGCMVRAERGVAVNCEVVEEVILGSRRVHPRERGVSECCRGLVEVFHRRTNRAAAYVCGCLSPRFKARCHSQATQTLKSCTAVLSTMTGEFYHALLLYSGLPHPFFFVL